MTIEIYAATWAQDRALLAAVRRTVFIEEQGVPEELEWDEADARAWHWLALTNARAVGTVRMLADGHIGRMAVLVGARRQGLGSGLLVTALAQASAIGLGVVYLDAQLQALPFYVRHGFRAEGPEFLDAGIAHRRMRRALTA